MQVTIRQLAPARIACLRHVGPYGDSVHRFWMDTVLPWRALQGLDQAPFYGIGRDDPRNTAPQDCRYDACVAVPDDFVAAPPARIEHLPGGRYAVAAFRGTVADAGPAWAWLLGEWLPQSGWRIDARPVFEYYPPDARHDAVSGVFDCLLCIPLRDA